MVRLLNISPDDFYAELQGKTLYLFGAGRASSHFHEVFCHYYPVANIIDNNANLYNTTTRLNSQSVKIISLASFVDIVKRSDINNILLLVTPVFYGHKILEQLDGIAALEGLPCALGSFLRYYPIAHKEVLFTQGKNIIPKKIHYCWFGGKPIPAHLQKYIDGWKVLCPDYEITQWNESNYDVFKNTYMYEAYKAKKWGFVPDYARLDIIYEHGGIYLDTDVALLRSPDVLLNDRTFFCFGNNDGVLLGVGFGGEARHPLLKSLRDFYNDKSFIKADGSYNDAPCYVYQHPVLKDWGFKLRNEYQKIDGVVLYPSGILADVGAPVTKQTVAQHNPQLSWVNADEQQSFRSTINAVISGTRTAVSTRKIKILQFPIASSFGGITHYALNNWKWMDKNKFTCDFATMSPSLDFADSILATGSKIHYISCYAEENREQFIKEFSSILSNGYDVVHLHTKQWKSTVVEDLCKQYGVKKVIVHSHSTECDNNDEQKRKAETELHYKIRSSITKDLATDFWACSKEAASWLFGEAIPPSLIKIMKNAIETKNFLFNDSVRQGLREQYHLKDKFVIGTVGRLCYQKNQAFLIEAFALACRTRDDLVLAIVGEGPLHSELEALAERLNIAHKVIFMGKQSNVNELYQMMDLFVLTSNFEGNPITAIEAQASGLHVLLADSITQEAKLTQDVIYLPLDKNVWATALAQSKTYTRQNTQSVIEESGYDAATQIKALEAEYAKLSGGGYIGIV